MNRTCHLDKTCCNCYYFFSPSEIQWNLDFNLYISVLSLDSSYVSFELYKLILPAVLQLVVKSEYSLSSREERELGLLMS